ncbi:MAG TPA: FMN-binding negative transcriptional regulator [Mesorhizobium sp.]|jgi:transcriptional regulator|nr:FMN-binding negative transcriptional regulator [Mesorhizobium sp.]
MTDSFAPRGPHDISDLIAAYPLATMIAQRAEGSPSIMLPLLAELDATGALLTLLGHIPRSHPLTGSWEADSSALVLFQGPQGYLSPSWVSDRTWAPTWAYAAVRIEANVRFLPQRTDEALERLVAALERGRAHTWSLAEMGDRYARLSRGVIGFCAEVRDVTARFRLGQDERPEVWRDLVANNPDQTLVAWMRRFGEPLGR